MTSQRQLPTPEAIWRQYDSDEARLTAPLSERMLDLAQLKPGMRVLDLATGRGEPAIRAAHRVGPSGRVVGVDTAAAMMQMAGERAAREGLSNLDLRVIDADSLPGIPEAHFHAVLARWGLMYFDAPVAALTAARRAMRKDAVLVAAIFVAPEQATYFTLPRDVLSKYAEVPPLEADAPGPFYYAAAGRLQRDFGAAGLRIEHSEDLRVDVMEAETAAGVIAWCRAFGMQRLLDGLSIETQQAWETDFAQAIEALRRDGKIRLGAVTRIVLARSA